MNVIRHETKTVKLELLLHPLNNDNEETLYTECGTMQLGLTTLGNAHFKLSFFSKCRFNCYPSGKKMQIFVNGEKVDYDVWEKNKEIFSDSINIEKSIEIDFFVGHLAGRAILR